MTGYHVLQIRNLEKHMSQRTSPEQRRAFYEKHQTGQSYQEIADEYGLSREVVRKWCRRQRDGGEVETRYHRQSTGQLSRFDPLVSYVILRLRLAHPRWGPQRIYDHLQRRPSLKGLMRPKPVSIGRYLRQWACLYPPKPMPRSAGVKLPGRVHECWQIDFKIGIALRNGSQVNLHTIRDPVGEVCISAAITPAGSVKQAAKRVSLADLQTTLRAGFLRWKTLPERIQTDNEALFTAQADDPFPSPFTLWLVGLGIQHHCIDPGQPTQNGAVERAHRTLYEYAVVGNEALNPAELHQTVVQAVEDLAFHFPSRAKHCHGQPPVVAHPELLQPLRPYRAQHELALFDLTRVDAYLASFTWRRKVQKNGQICIGGSRLRYSVGKAYTEQIVRIRFDPSDRSFVFYPDGPDDQLPPAELEIRRRPALQLTVADLTGLVTDTSGPQQLPLPLLAEQLGYVFNEQN
jgi:transposase InsO family protein